MWVAKFNFGYLANSKVTKLEEESPPVFLNESEEQQWDKYIPKRYFKNYRFRAVGNDGVEDGRVKEHTRRLEIRFYKQLTPDHPKYPLADKDGMKLFHVYATEKVSYLIQKDFKNFHNASSFQAQIDADDWGSIIQKQDIDISPLSLNVEIYDGHPQPPMKDDILRLIPNKKDYLVVYDVEKERIVVVTENVDKDNFQVFLRANGSTKTEYSLLPEVDLNLSKNNTNDALEEFAMKTLKLDDSEKKSIASGGYGNVFQLTYKPTDELVALKASQGWDGIDSTSNIEDEFALRHKADEESVGPKIYGDLCVYNPVSRKVKWFTAMQLADNSLRGFLLDNKNNEAAFRQAINQCRVVLRMHVKSGFFCKDLKLQNLAVFQQEGVKLIDIDHTYCEETKIAKDRLKTIAWTFFVDAMICISFLLQTQDEHFKSKQFEWFVREMFTEYVQGAQLDPRLYPTDEDFSWEALNHPKETIEEVERFDYHKSMEGYGSAVFGWFTTLEKVFEAMGDMREYAKNLRDSEKGDIQALRAIKKVLDDLYVTIEDDLGKILENAATSSPKRLKL
jgi:hypothetical protein